MWCDTLSNACAKRLTPVLRGECYNVHIYLVSALAVELANSGISCNDVFLC